MREAFWVLAAIALLAVGCALLVWQWGRRREALLATQRHLALHIAASAANASPSFGRRQSQGPLLDPWATAPVDPAAVEATRAGQDGGVRHKLAQYLPGWLHAMATPAQLGTAAAAGLVAVLGLGIFAGPVAACGLLALLSTAGSFGLWLRLQKFRRRLVRQLPGFIDGMVRLIRIGNSPQAAFQLSLEGLKPPLRESMEGVGALMRAGVDLDRALDQIADNLRVDALHLLAAILGLGIRYGGRADKLLDRVSFYMRDREQAEQELVAMSSETRLSAWILGLMPIGVCAAIMLVNPTYVARMWYDGTGQMMIFGAVGLQILGVLLLYRLARLD